MATVSNNTLLTLGFHLQSIAPNTRNLSIVDTTARLAQLVSGDEASTTSFVFNTSIASIATFLGASPADVASTYEQAGLVQQDSSKSVQGMTVALGYFFASLPHDVIDVKGTKVMIPLVVAGILIVILRLWSRWMAVGRIRFQDWMIVVALMLSNAVIIVGLIAGNSYGSSHHKWDLPWSEAVTNTKFAYVDHVLYHPIMFFIKLSTLLFYYSIAPSGNGPYSAILHVTLALISVLTMVNGLALAFQCIPVSSIWDLPTEAKCTPKVFIGYEYGVVDIASNIVLLLLAVYPVWRLRRQLKFREMILLAAVFGLGAAVCVVSGFRLRAVYNFAASLDTTWYEVDLGVLSALEINLGIICTSIPSIRALVMRFLPALLGYGEQRNMKPEEIEKSLERLADYYGITDDSLVVTKPPEDLEGGKQFGVKM